MNFPEPQTDAERDALKILRDAKLETDEDYIALIHLLDDNGQKFLDIERGEDSQ